MAKLYNNASGKWEDVEDVDVPTAVSSGSHSMESGLRIPVVRPDGRLSEIDSKDSGVAFSKGYRLPSIHDQEAYYDRTNEAIKQKAFGDQTGTALAAGALRGATFGASDVALNAAGLDEAAQQVKERNPIASQAGEIGGLVGSSMLIPGGGVAGAGERIGTTVAKEVGGALAESGAKGIVARLSSKALGSAVEGAYYGAGQTVSEQALGSPETVVDNLATNVGFGALFGGILGAGFAGAREAKPFLVDVAKKAYGSTAEYAQALARKVAGNSLESQLGGEAGATAKELALNPELRAKAAQAAEFESELGAGNSKDVASVNKQAANIRRGLETELKDLPESVKTEAQSALHLTDNDIAKATDTLYQQVRQGDDVLNNHMAAELFQRPPQMKADAQSVIDATIDGLRNTGTKVDRELAKELMSINRARISTIDNAAQEIQGYKLVKEELGKADWANLSDLGRKQARSLRDYIKESLSKDYPDPVVNQYFQFIDDKYSAIKAMSKATATEAKISKIFFDPTKQEAMSGVFSSLSELAPEFQSFQRAAGDYAKQSKIAQDAYVKFRELQRTQNLQGARVGYNEFKEVFDGLTGPTANKMAPALDKLKALEEAVKTQGLSNWDAAIQLKRALGQPVQDLEKYAPFAKHAEVLNRLNAGGAGTESSAFGTAYSAAKAVTRPISTAVSMLKTGYTPESVYKTLTAIERASNKGARALESATTHVADVLTGARFEKTVFLSQMGTDNSKETQKERFKRYQSITENLNRISNNPSAVMNHMDQVSLGADGIPGIKQAMTTKLTQATGYLQAHAPVDPLAGTSIYANKTGYQPSDSELASFMRRVDVVHNPIVAVKAIGAGDATPEQIDALKSVYPEVYNRLQTKTISAIMDHGEDIPYPRKLVISQMFGTPVDYSMTPEFIKQAQANLLPSDEGGRPDGATDSSPRKSKLDLKPFESLQSEADHTTYKDND